MPSEKAGPPFDGLAPPTPRERLFRHNRGEVGSAPALPPCNGVLGRLPARVRDELAAADQDNFIVYFVEPRPMLPPIAPAP